MPRILEIKEIENELWVRVGKPGDFPSGVSLWTTEEERAKYRSGYSIGYEDAKEGREYKP